MDYQSLSDEEQIRQLVSDWSANTQSGNVDAVLALMTDDVLFLTPGNEPMKREAFEAALRSMVEPDGPKFESKQDIQEIQVLGECAYMWSKLRVGVMMPSGKASVIREGHTLTIFRKLKGRWLLARDANMLVRVTAETS